MSDENSFIVSKTDAPFQILSLLYEFFSLFFSWANITNPVKRKSDPSQRQQTLAGHKTSLFGFARALSRRFKTVECLELPVCDRFFLVKRMFIYRSLGVIARSLRGVAE